MESQVSQVKPTKSLNFSGFYSYLKTLPKDSWQYNVLKRFFYLAQVYEDVKPSQGRLAHNFGVSRMTINTYVAFLKNLGIFRVKRRGLYQSARYIFAEEFQDDHVRGTLGSFFKAFCYMSYKKRQSYLFKPTLHSIELIEILENERDLSGDCLTCEVGESPCFSCPALNVSFKNPERGRSPSPNVNHGSSLSSKENEMNEDNYNYTDVKPSASLKKPIVRTFSRSISSQPIQRGTSLNPKGDIQAFVGSLERLSTSQLQEELYKECNKESVYTTNPRNIVGPDYRRVKALKAELARRQQAPKNDDSEKILTTDYFGHDNY